MRLTLPFLQALALIALTCACGVKGNPEPLITKIPQPRLIKKDEKGIPTAPAKSSPAPQPSNSP